MAGTLELDRIVRGLEHGLGDFRPGERRTGGGLRSQVPMVYQVLDPERFFVAFEPGSQTYQVLANDQNRFSPPRSLPPILDLELPEDVDNPTGAYVVARYAYSEGAFRLLEDVLAEGHVFGMNGFLEFAWSLATALAFLHEHEIVHGQWNAKSVVAVPTEQLAHPMLEVSNYRFEVINTGVCFRNIDAIPGEYLERGYYPPEVFLSEGSGPDYGALDLVGDVFCFAAFLKDLMQRSCSSEELPSQARRILEELQKEANRRGWKASPESLRRKEMEILDHLYTIRVRSESLIQEALLPRDERCTAGHLRDVVEELHDKAVSYLEELFAKGFEPVNAFGDGLQHYTTFQLDVSPAEINSYQDSHVVLTGRGLPHELVRVTLNETHQGVKVLSARPGRIEFVVERGFRSGQYRVSVNNRRTNGALEVFSSAWTAIEPREVHQPWEGFGNIRMFVRGERLPKEAEFALRSTEGGDKVAAVVVLPAAIEEGTEDALQLTFPCDTAAGEYELLANGRPTGLTTRVLDQLPEPVVNADGLQPEEVKNHRRWSLRITGRNLHPDMVVDFGEDTPNGLHVSVINPGEAELEIPDRFPAGEYPLRLNFQETGAQLRVIEPRWTGVDPAAVKLLRSGKAPLEFRIAGDSLPEPCEETRYTLQGRGAPVTLEANEAETDTEHILHGGPQLPRGRCALRFGELDTGLRVRVRRQMPRAAVAALWLVSLTALGGAGVAVRQAMAPQIGSVDPAEVYAFGAPTVTLSGAHLAAVQLVNDGGQSIAEFAVTEGDEPGSYQFVPRQAPPGRYRLQPIGSLFSSTATDHELTLLPPGFGLEPSVVHTLEYNEVRLTADAGFDISGVTSLSLHDPETGQIVETLPLTDGRVAIPQGSLRQGGYPVAIDGMRPVAGDPLLLQVLGPAVAGVAPNPVSRDAEGGFFLELDGAHLEPAALVLQGAVDGQTHDLERANDGAYRSMAPPGEYLLALAAEDGEPEALSELIVTVLPTPVVAAVAPQKLEPGVSTEVTFTGTNLAALEHVVLRPEGDVPGVRIPIVADQIRLDGTYSFAVSLSPGTWQVLPADTPLILEVFADCSDALTAYAETGELDALRQCLEEGRPPAHVIRGAADLFFDRGLFDEARALYADSSDLVARFRTSFIDAFLHGQGVPLLVPEGDERSSAYAVAAARMGWSGVRWREFSEAALPWELEYVQGLTSEDVEAAASAFERSIDKKASASDGFEASDFGPAFAALAGARLDLAVQLIGRVEVPRARGLLADRLIGDARTWSHLSADEQSLALFWLGHLRLWYDGDHEAAATAFQRGATLNGPAVPWNRQYLAAISGEPQTETSAADPSWEPTFVRVFELFREALRSPNYNLLAAGRDTGSYLSSQEREKSAELRQLVETLEALEPSDPFTHYALLYGLRSAQKISWPAQTGSRVAEDHRARLLGMTIPGEIEPVRQAYVILGELEPYDFTQVTTLTRSERSEMAERISSLQGLPLPERLRESVELIGQRFLDPSVVWWRQIRK